MVSVPESEDPIAAVEFSILFDGDEEKFAHLWAMRDISHRMLNAGISEWHRADKVVSQRLDVSEVCKTIAQKLVEASKPTLEKVKELAGTTDPEALGLWAIAQIEAAQLKGGDAAIDNITALKRLLDMTGIVVDERKPVTMAVKHVLAGERAYWARQLPVCQAQVETARVQLGRAKNKEDAEAIADAENKLKGALSSVVRARVRSAIEVPSSVYDAVVRFTAARLAVYNKEAFRGGRSLDTYDAYQPVRWRNGSWGFESHEGKRGHYKLTLELSSGKRVTRGSFDLIPDGPKMHMYAKRMADEKAIARKDVKLCDARVVYSEKKKQWFVKLTIRYKRLVVPSPPGGFTAALRRGVNNAFTLIFETPSGGKQCRDVSGEDILAFKRRTKARTEALRRHMSKFSLGGGSRDRGKTHRYRHLRKIGDAEDLFVDSWCKRNAAAIAAECVDRHVSRLLVAKMDSKDMQDGDDTVQALLYQWPFARFLDEIRSACSKVPVNEKGQALHGKARHNAVGYAQVTVDEFDANYDARRCPGCKHVHDKRPVTFTELHGGTCSECRHTSCPGAARRVRMIGTFKCEVCEFERPADQIVAWNGLLRAVGQEPLEVAKASKKALVSSVTTALHGALEE